MKWGSLMTKDPRDLLTVLKDELAFVEKGGYRNTAHAAWRPQFIFQDSPACLNFDPTQQPKPCSDCILMQLVPEAERHNKIACRYISLNEQGETIDWFYRFGTRDDLETNLRKWLRATIKRLELEKVGRLETSASGDIEVHVRAKASQGA